MNEIAWCKPESDEYAEYYEPYMQLVGESDLLVALDDQIAEFNGTLDISESEAEVSHEPYTWTIKQVVGHLIDNERVFAYRAMRFAVADPIELPGYEQDDYVANSDYQTVTLQQLKDEFVQLRKSNLLMLRRIRPAAWNNRGTSDGREMTVRAIACLLVGHVRHHLQIVGDRLAS